MNQQQKEQGIKFDGEHKIQINGQQTIEIVHNDLKKERVCAIVKRTNSKLLQFGSWLRATGQKVRDEAKDWLDRKGEIPIGGCAVTSPGNGDPPVNAKHHILHVHPPFYREEVYEKRELLKTMMNNILD